MWATGTQNKRVMREGDVLRPSMGVVHLFHILYMWVDKKESRALLPITYSSAQSDPTLMISFAFSPSSSSCCCCHSAYQQTSQISLLIMTIDRRIDEGREKRETETPFDVGCLITQTQGV